MENAMDLVSNVYVGFLLLVLVGAVSYALSELGKYIQKQYKITDLEALEQAAYAAVLSAEQVFKNTYDIVDDFLPPEEKAKIDAEIEKYNKDKKAYAVDFVARQFLDLDPELIDRYVEYAVKLYKISSQTVKNITEEN